VIRCGQWYGDVVLAGLTGCPDIVALCSEEFEWLEVRKGQVHFIKEHTLRGVIETQKTLSIGTQLSIYACIVSK